MVINKIERNVLDTRLFNLQTMNSIIEAIEAFDDASYTSLKTENENILLSADEVLAYRTMTLSFNGWKDDFVIQYIQGLVKIIREQWQDYYTLKQDSCVLLIATQEYLDTLDLSLTTLAKIDGFSCGFDSVSSMLYKSHEIKSMLKQSKKNYAAVVVVGGSQQHNAMFLKGLSKGLVEYSNAGIGETFILNVVQGFE